MRVPRCGTHSLCNRYPLLCHPERSRPVPACRGGICSFRGPFVEMFSTEESWAGGPPKVMKKRFGAASTLYVTVTLSFVIPGEARGICSSPRTLRGDVFRQRSLGLRPTQGDEKTSVRHPLFMEQLLLPCHPDRSEAERRDLRFRRPFVQMFSTERG
jgi:hypothetical protein